jgi:hypothetical protein
MQSLAENPLLFAPRRWHRRCFLSVSYSAQMQFIQVAMFLSQGFAAQRFALAVSGTTDNI